MPSRTRLAAAGLGASAVAAVPTGALAASYAVRSGDTLTGIALRHGVSVHDLAAANGIRNADRVRVGQVLRIPDRSLALPRYTAGAVDSETYVTRPGDTLARVARAFGIDAATLARANGLRARGALRPGTQIHVPGRLLRASALLTSVAREVGISPALARAVAWMESGWQQNVVSPTGAIGMMQVEPYTGDWISHHLAGRPLDLHAAGDNVRAGTLLLHHLLGVHGGDPGWALAGYYQGDASISRHGLYDDTRRYIAVIARLIRSE